MKKILLVVFFVSLVVLAGCGSNVDENAFVSEAGRFSANFPTRPAESVDKVPTEVGEIDAYMFSYQEGSSKIYIISYSDYPEDFVTLENSKSLLEGVKKGQLSALGENVKIDKEEEIEVDGFDGVYVKANGDDIYVASKTILADSRLYQVMFMMEKSYPAQEEEDKFLGSFKILKD